MYSSTNLLSVPHSSQAVLPQTTRALQKAGLRVVQSFDLQAARVAHTGCTCPNHGTELCDCQMVVLLVYSAWEGSSHPSGEPVTLVVHGRDGHTELGLVNTPQQPASPQLLEAIRFALDEVNPCSSQASTFS